MRKKCPTNDLKLSDQRLRIEKSKSSAPIKVAPCCAPPQLSHPHRDQGVARRALRAQNRLRLHVPDSGRDERDNRRVQNTEDGSAQLLLQKP